MKSFVYIALVAFLGVPVQAYGPNGHYNYHGRIHGPLNRSPDEFQHSPHGPYYRPPPEFYYFSQPYGYFGPTQPWDDSTEWDSGSKENDEYSSETLDDWYDFLRNHHSKGPCKRHCKTKKPSMTALIFAPKTTNTNKQTQATVSHLTANPFSTPRSTRTVSSTEALGKTTSPQPTTTTEEEFTTLTPEVLSCFDSCRSTPEFNPVCGTDGETYENEGMLFCAKSCGIDVSLQRRSVCPPPVFIGGGDEETPPTLPPTTETTRTRTIPVSRLQLCMKQCAITPYITPVCGTDFVTYMNIDRLKCARSCGEDVDVLCNKACAACGITPPTAKPKTTPSKLTTETLGRTTQKPDKKECLAKCPATSESNPVCGTDQVTYRNPSHLLCAQLCGVGVSIDRFSPCLPTTTNPPLSTSTTFEFPTSTISPTQLSCFTNCPVTSEYNPVCGTDDLTYTNPGYIECAKLCGIEVAMKSKLPCELLEENTDSTTPTTTQKTNESKEQVTTVSRSNATTTSLFTSPIRTTTPVSTLTTTAVPISITTTTPISTSTRFTIPSNILNNVFGTATAQPTSSANPDDDEDVDIDTRFSIDTGNNNTNISRIIFPE